MTVQKIFLPFVFAFVVLFLSATSAKAAVSDGPGPWADTVVSSSQGTMKNGSSVPVIRSDTNAALGVAEETLLEGTFYSLGFGGSITLGFDNAVSGGAVVVESTNPGYPLEKATVSFSYDGVSWVNGGQVTQDGTVDLPSSLSCAKYVKVTDASVKEDFTDETADGYDVDGVRTMNTTSCPQTTPTPSPTPTVPPCSCDCNEPVKVKISNNGAHSKNSVKIGNGTGCGCGDKVTQQNTNIVTSQVSVKSVTGKLKSVKNTNAAISEKSGSSTVNVEISTLGSVNSVVK